MRIAIAGFYHETNWFGNVLVTPDVLEKGKSEGNGLIEIATGVRNYRGGIIDEAALQGVELVPTIYYHMLPSGHITKEALEIARTNIVKSLCDAHAEQPLDAIALAMHGGGAADGYPDAEGEILRAIREAFGKDIPIGVCLDLHGNITQDMVDLSDVLIGVRCYPHSDEYETGREMFSMLCDVVRTGSRPCMRLVKLPWLLVSAQGLTMSGPGSDVREFCMEEESQNPKLLRSTFFHGFPYADVSCSSVSVVTVAKDQETADSSAMKIARYAWNRRKDFTAPIYSAAEAVDLALSYEEGPVIINESSDNPGGGTPADGTHLLRELLHRNVPAAFGFICDSEVVKQAIEAGVGSHISCRLGGKTDKYHGEPIEIADAYVRSISDGEFIRRPPMGGGMRVCLGMTVCLVVGNVSIVVGNKRTQTFDDGPFRIAGIDWQSQRILALKSSLHFRAWWSDKVRGIVPCDSPGIHSADLTTLPIKNVDMSYYPLGDPSWEE